MLLVGTICLVALIEMSGRLAAMSHHTIAGAMRERFGLRFFVLPLVGVVAVSVLTLAAELGAVCIALQLATGVSFQWWAVPVMVALWLLLWRGNFGVVENGVSLLGLVTVVFLVAAARLHPTVREMAAGFVPSGAPYDASRYWFLAVSILGATLTPYLFYFYSSGAVEDGWVEKLGLTIHPSKTRLCSAREEPFDFLGYTFGPSRHWQTGKRQLSAWPIIWTRS